MTNENGLILAATNSSNSITVDSREVAKWSEKDHKHLLVDIRGYTEELQRLLEETGEPTFRPADYFKENSYADSQGKQRPCYNVTKKGCAFVANKLNGRKGIKFTAQYTSRFEEMDTVIRGMLIDMPQMTPLQLAEANLEISQNWVKAERALVEARGELTQYKELTSLQREKLEEQEDDANLGRTISMSEGSISVGDFATLLQNEGIRTGQNLFYKWMQDAGYVCKKGSRKNKPTQKSLNSGWLELEEYSKFMHSQEVPVTVTRVTGKGQKYFVNLILKNEKIRRGLEETHTNKKKGAVVR